MIFNILIKMKTNRSEYIEYPIVPVVEQPPHGIHEASNPVGAPLAVAFAARQPIFPREIF